MVQISNFSSVLEIAFSVNALLYVFEVIPHTEDKLQKLAEKWGDVVQEKVRLTGDHEAFPLGFYIGNVHYAAKLVMTKFTVIASSVALGMLAYVGFRPDTTISSTSMGLLLAFVFGVPLLALYLHRRTLRIAEAVIDQMEAKNRDLRYQSKSAANDQPDSPRPLTSG